MTAKTVRPGNEFTAKSARPWLRIWRNCPRMGSPRPTHGLSLSCAPVSSDFPADASTLSPSGKCKNAQKPDLAYDALRAALYSCFDELANNLQFEGGTVNRVSAFSLLEQIKEPERRKKLFLAFNPLWEAVNGKDQPDSPYRRMIRMAAADANRRRTSRQSPRPPTASEFSRQTSKAGSNRFSIPGAR